MRQRASMKDIINFVTKKNRIDIFEKDQNQIETNKLETILTVPAVFQTLIILFPHLHFELYIL